MKRAWGWKRRHVSSRLIIDANGYIINWDSRLIDYSRAARNNVKLIYSMTEWRSTAGISLVSIKLSSGEN